MTAATSLADLCFHQQWLRIPHSPSLPSRSRTPDDGSPSIMVLHAALLLFSNLRWLAICTHRIFILLHINIKKNEKIPRSHIVCCMVEIQAIFCAVQLQRIGWCYTIPIIYTFQLPLAPMQTHRGQCLLEAVPLQVLAGHIGVAGAWWELKCIINCKNTSK